MKSTRIMSIALIACAAVASIAYASYNFAVDIAVSTYCHVKAMVLDGIKLVAAVAAKVGHPAISQAQAKAFVMRLAKRERPMLTASWRMCPSV